MNVLRTIRSFLLVLICTATLAGCKSTAGPSNSPELIKDNSPSNTASTRDKSSQEASRRLGCIELNEIDNSMSPLSLFIGMKQCLNDSELDNAANMYFFARLYGAFDGRRVDDNSADQAIAVIHRAIFSKADKKVVEKFQTHLNEDYGKGSPKFSAFCQAARKNGPPKYYPKYMIQHGIKAFSGIKGDGLKHDFDTGAEWGRIYSRNCEDKKGRQANWPKTRFEIYKGTVIYKSPWGERTVGKADTETFEALGEAFGRDNNNVFFGEKIVSGADPSSFQVFDFYMGRDNTSVYRGTIKCKECDPDTFRVIGDDRYADKHTVYKGTGDSYIILPDVDVATYKTLNTWFTKDKNYAYHLNSIIPGADVASFKLANCGICEVCAEDKNRCYSYKYPVPCDCKGYNGPRLYKITKIPVNNALLYTPHFRLDLAENGNDKAIKVKGQWQITPGKHTYNLQCGTERGSIDINAKSKHVYRIKKRKGTTCDAELSPIALVQGNDDGPIVYITMDVLKEAKSEVELEPGKHKITAVCRDVNRERVRENSVELNMTLEAGRVYKLNADFLPPEDKCDVRVTLVE